MKPEESIMRMNRKLMSITLCAVLLVMSILGLTSCSPLNAGSANISGQSIEVAKLQYSEGNSNEFFHAQYYTQVEKESVSREEFEKNGRKAMKYVLSSGSIAPDNTVNIYENNETKSVSVDEIKKLEGKTFYAYDARYNEYVKIKYKKIVIANVHVRFLNDGSFIVSQYKNADEVIQRHRIRTENYVMTYFIEP